MQGSLVAQLRWEDAEGRAEILMLAMDLAAAVGLPEVAFPLPTVASPTERALNRIPLLTQSAFTSLFSSSEYARAAFPGCLQGIPLVLSLFARR